MIDCFYLTNSSSARSTLRLRLYGDDEDKCVLTHKGPSVIQDGVSSVQETEHHVDQEVARRAISDPSLLLQMMNSSVMQRVRKDHPNLISLQSLGICRILYHACVHAYQLTFKTSIVSSAIVSCCI